MTDSAFDDYTPTDDVYHGTRGASGSSSSEDAAYADLVHGVTNVTQRLVLILAAQAGTKGITVAEVREQKGSLHHGRISSALTKQHIAGKLVALHERRGHCGVYVLPEYVNGRTVRPYHRSGKKPINEEIIVGVLLRHTYRDSRPGSPSHCDEGDWTGGPGGSDHSYTQHVARRIAEALSA